ncbi:protein ripply2 [Cyprinus carpio]|uniref:Protein ripply2 n=1 Tax=Cyprinus carpio TaxID=7962 RepID=A0A9Q9X1A9_CYPCA|nr:protein ripply2 [Cyprinus carpio]XP_042593398.1 protein ripply2 [Cyprinus carpio]
MESITFTHGLNAETNATRLWRPWIDKSRHGRKTNAYTPYGRASADPKVPVISHPVKLFWPKSRCFDYLYLDAEILLRSYPVQATICMCEDSESDDEEDDEEEHEKERS